MTTVADRQCGHGRRTNVGWGAMLALLVVVAYLPALWAGFIWDDDWHITANRQLRSAAGLWRIWFEWSRPGHVVIPQYYPLTHTTFWLEYHLWGLWAPGYHAVNVLLHAAAVVLLWRVLERVRVPGAWWVAAVWGVHPVMVESVAWATERKNVLSACFYFLAMLAYWKFQPLRIADFGLRIERKGRWGWYAGALGLFVCGLLAKTAIVGWPAVVLLVGWWKRGRVTWSDVWPLAPFFAAAVGMGLVTSHMELVTVGAASDWSLPAVERVMVAGRVLCFYAWKVVWPAGLAFNYERWDVSRGVWWQWLFPAAAALVIGGLLALRRRIGRGPATAALFYAGTLAPVLGFVNVYMMRYAFVGDHLAYVADIGVVALVVGGTAWMTRDVKGRWPAVAGGVVIAVLAGLTWVRAGVFRSQEAVWGDTLAKNPRSWLAHTSLEKEFAARGDWARAVSEVRQALEIRPGDAKLWSRLAMDLAGLGDERGAREAYRRAIELDPRDPVVRYNYGSDLARWGELEAAEGELVKAATAEDAAAGVTGLAWENLGNVRLKRADAAGAEEALSRAVEAEPGLANARNTLATLKLKRGDVEGGEREARRAVAEDPDLAEARNTLASALMMKGDLEGAERELAEALRIRPGFAQAKANLEKVRGARQAGAGR